MSIRMKKTNAAYVAEAAEVERQKLVRAARRVWRAFLAWGPVDDGRPEGDEFDRALIELGAIANVRG
jgi:hypothetical protein